MSKQLLWILVAVLAVDAVVGLEMARAQEESASGQSVALDKAARNDDAVRKQAEARKRAELKRQAAMRNLAAARRQAAQARNGNVNGMNFNGGNGVDPLARTNMAENAMTTAQNNPLAVAVPGNGLGTFGSGTPLDSFRLYPNAFPNTWQDPRVPGVQYLAPNPVYNPAFGRSYSNQPSRIQSTNPMYKPAFGRSYSNQP
jgi:hypothetical protein